MKDIIDIGVQWGWVNGKNEIKYYVLPWICTNDTPLDNNEKITDISNWCSQLISFDFII